MLKTVLTILALAVMGYIFYQYSSSKSAAGDRINPETFKQKYKETPGLVIDVRTRGEYESGHLALTDHNFDVTNGEFQSKLDSLDKEKTYYLYCRSGNRSGKALSIMKDKGFEQVYNVGGFSELANAGLETKK